MTEQLKPEGKYWAKRNDDGKRIGDWVAIFEQPVNPGMLVSMKTKEGKSEDARINKIRFSKERDGKTIYFCDLVSWQAWKSIQEGNNLGIPVKKKDAPPPTATTGGEATKDELSEDEIPF